MHTFAPTSELWRRIRFLASVLYFPFGQHLEEQLRAALVSAQLILKNGL
jgi:hypothetical protein